MYYSSSSSVFSGSLLLILLHLVYDLIYSIDFLFEELGDLNTKYFSYGWMMMIETNISDCLILEAFEISDTYLLVFFWLNKNFVHEDSIEGWPREVVGGPPSSLS